MPLEAKVVRDGELLQLPWESEFDYIITAMIITAAMESGKGPLPENTKEWLSSHVELVNSQDESVRQFIYGYDWFPITGDLAFTCASYRIVGTTPLGDSTVTLKERHRFKFTTGTKLELLPGDELNAVKTW